MYVFLIKIFKTEILGGEVLIKFLRIYENYFFSKELRTNNSIFLNLLLVIAASRDDYVINHGLLNYLLNLEVRA